MKDYPLDLLEAMDNIPSKHSMAFVFRTRLCNSRTTGGAYIRVKFPAIFHSPEFTKSFPYEYGLHDNHASRVKAFIEANFSGGFDPSLFYEADSIGKWRTYIYTGTPKRD